MIHTEDLQENGLFICVEKPGFSYGSDALRLAAFARLKRGERALDLGAGTGILSILLASRHGAHFTAIEIQEEMCALMEKSVAINAQEDSIEIRCADLRALKSAPSFEHFDAAVCNPPYFAGGTKSESEQRRASRHQDSCTMRDAASCAARLLRQGGRFYICCPATLLADCCAALVENGMQPKRLKLEGARLALIEAKKGGKPGLTLEIE